MDVQLEQPKKPLGKINPASIASLCFGVLILTLTCWIFYHGLPGVTSLLVPLELEVGGGLLGLAGSIIGAIGFFQVRKSAGRQKGRSAAIAGTFLCAFVLFYFGMELSTNMMYFVIPEYRLTHPQNEALPGLAGNWQDPQTKLVHTIAWKADGGYAVLYVLDATHAARRIESQSWSNGRLTWAYSDSGETTTFEAGDLHGDQLEVSWSAGVNGKVETGLRSLTRLRWDRYVLPASGD